jgi:hypothetical protein
MTYATFVCQRYHDWERCCDEDSALLAREQFADPENVTMPDACCYEFSEVLPLLGEDLPACPGCGGSTVLLSLLEPATAG